MRREVVFHPAAEEDLRAAAERYAAIRPSLGAAFVDRVEVSVRRAGQAPMTGAPMGGQLRRLFVTRFPYYVIYLNDDSRVLILAVAHFRRRPGFWRIRV